MPERLDKFLWAARFIRTRKAAQKFIETSRPRVNHQPTTKPHTLIKEGDIITLALGSSIRIIKVKMLSARRFPAKLALSLYEDLDQLR